MANKTIPALPIYGSQDSDKRKKDLIEITKNDGTYATPTYGTGASRKMSVEELKTALDITSQTVTDGITDKSPSENAVFDAVYAKGLINGTIWVNAYTALGDFNLSIDKYNNVGYTDAEGPISVILPTHTASMSGKTIIVEPHRFNSGLTTVNISIPGLQVDGGGGAGTYTEVITKMGQIVTIQANYYGWHVIGYTNQVPDISFKLDLDGSNANQDIDIDGFGVNAKHFKVNGTGGSGHIGLKHQSANISASASESSIGADSVGDPVWKNDGGAIDKLELQSNKTSTVTGNEASTTKYLTVKGVYDWAVGLFAPKASPTFTGTITTPDIVVSNATASTPAFFDAVDKLISTTAQLWGTWVQTWASKATPVDADTIGFYNSASTFVGVKSTLLNFWTAYLLPKVQTLGYLTGSLTTNYIPYWNGTSLVNSLATNNIADGGIDINSGYIYARKTTGGYVAYFDFRSTSGSAAIIMSQQTKALLVEGNTNRTTSDPASIIINRVTSGELAWFQAFDANATQRNGTSKQSASIYLQRSGRNSSAADIANDGYNVGIFAQLSPNTTSNKDISGSFNFTQIDYVNNKGAWIAYISNIQVASIGQDGVSVGSNAINASAILQADSTTKGFLPPRMTNAQRTNIVSPAIGLMVYCTDSIEGLYIYKSTGWTFII
jgi:hypothetical protein